MHDHCIQTLNFSCAESKNELRDHQQYFSPGASWAPPKNNNKTWGGRASAVFFRQTPPLPPTTFLVKKFSGQEPYNCFRGTFPELALGRPAYYAGMLDHEDSDNINNP